MNDRGPAFKSLRTAVEAMRSEVKRAALCDPVWVWGWDAAPDGRFIVVRPSEAETASREIRLILNWTDELKRRVPH